MLDTILQGLGIKSTAAAIGGAVGSIMSLQFHNGLNRKGKVILFFSGFFFACYTTTLAAHAFSIGSDYFGGIGFLIGWLGMVVVSAIIKVLPDIIKAKLGSP